MKKIIAIFAISILTISASAQENNSETTNSEIKNITVGVEYSLMYSPEIETYGFSIAAAMNKLFHLDFGITSNLKSAKKGSTYFGYMGVGIHQGIFLGDSFMMDFALTPYIGYSSYSYEIVTGMLPYGGHQITTTEDENEFTYGATADVNVGFKISKSYCLNIGYKIFAGEFKTKNMFKSGFIKVGLSSYF